VRAGEVDHEHDSERGQFTHVIPLSMAMPDELAGSGTPAGSGVEGVAGTGPVVSLGAGIWEPPGRV
jgi:hypothetical protein